MVRDGCETDEISAVVGIMVIIGSSGISVAPSE
jgi:hypothetical protein